MKEKTSRVNIIQKRKRKAAFVKWIRIAVQMMFLVLIPAVFSQAFGAVKDVAETIGRGESISWTIFTTKFAVLCFVTMVLGRVFCGWACAFGALGDWLYQIGQVIQKKSGKKLPVMPEKIQVILQKMKYIVLLLILVICFFGETQRIAQFSPWTVFSLITSGGEFGGYKYSIIAIVFVMIGMIYKERFFCQFLCPLGAIFSLLPQWSFLKLKRNQEKCIPNCTLCKRNCPVHIKLQEEEYREGECIMCGRCKYGCPKNNIKIKMK